MCYVIMPFHERYAATYTQGIRRRRAIASNVANAGNVTARTTSRFPFNNQEIVTSLHTAISDRGL